MFSQLITEVAETLTTTVTEMRLAIKGQNFYDWRSVLSFRPPQDVQRQVMTRGSLQKWFFHKIEEGWGPVTLDEYPILVEQLPLVNGTRMTADELLKYWRLNINDFVDTSVTKFEPYEDSDKVKWSSDKPAGAVILIRVQPIGPFEAERAAVVVGESATDHWTFTTIWTENSEVHPVSGNRTFGFRPHGDQYVYFTRGADRFSQPGYWAMSKIVRSGQESLWHSLQSRFADFVNARQGRARVLAPYIAYPSWTDERIRTSFQPTVEWETGSP